MIQIKVGKDGKIITGIWDEIPSRTDVPKNPKTLLGLRVVYIDPPKVKRREPWRKAWKR